MALITPGYWPSTYWPSGNWHEDYWPEYGAAAPVAAVPAAVTSGGTRGRMRRPATAPARNRDEQDLMDIMTIIARSLN